MFTNNEVLEYSGLLQNLNHQDGRPLPDGYAIILSGGGKDGIPHYQLLENHEIYEYVLWIRGTDFTDANDLHINMKTSPVKFYNGTCHKGYLNAALKIIEEIRGYLTNPQINKFVCIGHSLGGAVSSVIVTIFNKGDYPNQFTNMNSMKEKFDQGGTRGLVFGTPPTFSPDISKETSQYITNIILKKDVIPKLGETFNSLSKFQIRIVTMIFGQYESAKKYPNKKIAMRNYQKHMKKQHLPDQLPGNVIVFNSKGDKFENGKNHRIIHKTTDWFGIVQHLFSNYHHVISNTVEGNDKVFIGVNKKKKSRNIWPAVKNTLHYNIIIPYRYTNHIFKALENTIFNKKKLVDEMKQEFKEESNYCDRKIFQYL